MDKGIKLSKIVIPTNGSFLLDYDKTAKVEEYMKKFHLYRCYETPNIIWLNEKMWACREF